MRYAVKLIVFIWILVLGSGCCSIKNKIDFTTIREFNPSKIETIQARGPFCLRIITGAKKNRIYIKGLSSSVSGVDAQLENGKLFLSSSASDLWVDVEVVDLQFLQLQNMNKVSVKGTSRDRFSVWANDVRHLDLSGDIKIPELNLSGRVCLTSHGKFTIDTFNNNSSQDINLETVLSDNMIINNNSPAKVTLHGYINLHKLTQNGNGTLEIYWLKSRGLMNADIISGIVNLAGTAQKVTAQVANDAQLNARYLRADNLLVKTFDNAKANVQALKQFMGDASGSSIIKYYGNPSVVKSGVFKTEDQGVILRGMPNNKDQKMGNGKQRIKHRK